MKFHNMIYQLKEFCSEHKCDTCPLLDKDTDMCSLHLYCPEEWDIQKIKEVLASNEPNNAHKGGY